MFSCWFKLTTLGVRKRYNRTNPSEFVTDMNTREIDTPSAKRAKHLGRQLGQQRAGQDVLDVARA